MAANAGTAKDDRFGPVGVQESVEGRVVGEPGVGVGRERRGDRVVVGANGEGVDVDGKTPAVVGGASGGATGCGRPVAAAAKVEAVGEGGGMEFVEGL